MGILESHFARLTEILLPNGGHVLALMEAYFDESYGDDSAFLCVSGYLFERDKAVALDVEWRKMLAKYELPFFHMADCAHGFGHYKHLSRDERIAAQTEAINLIKSHATLGISNSIEIEPFSKLPPGIVLESVYSYASLQCFFAVRKWIEDNNYNGDIAYFYEAGHKHQSDSQAFMNRVFMDATLREHYRYASHAFIPKTTNAAIQCADILAWQWHTETKKIVKGEPSRKDLMSLLELPHFNKHFDANELAKFASIAIQRGQLEALKASVIPGYRAFKDHFKYEKK